MKLSEIQTADALIMQLASLGYVKVKLPTSDCFSHASKGLYYYRIVPWNNEIGGEITVLPFSEYRSCGEAGFVAAIDDQDRIAEWFAFGSASGVTYKLHRDTELDVLEQKICDWLNRSPGSGDS